MDYILGYKTGLNSFKIEMHNMFSNNNEIKLEISIRYLKKTQSVWKLSHTCKTIHDSKELQVKLENIFNWMKMKIHHVKICGMQLNIRGKFTVLNAYNKKQGTDFN